MRIFQKKNKAPKTLGLINDQAGIINRYLREKEGWNSHLNHTKKFILDFLKNKKGNIALLGSGWLLDVPVEEISDAFENVYLIDIYHPPQVQHQLKKYKNVFCIESDITGGLINEIYTEYKKNRGKQEKINLEQLTFQEYSLENLDINVAISINLLSQLDTLLADFLIAQKLVSEDYLEDFRKKVQESHIMFLKKYKSCLITDFEEWVFNTELNKITTKKLIYCEVPHDKNTRNWDWLFDMSGMYNDKKKTIMKVMATVIND
ncbi:MAG: hypothetical protein GXO79_15495 [Chlorobi bacterium]|nr:hypothetical protein [Chlorobiota bacterium]